VTTFGRDDCEWRDWDWKAIANEVKTRSKAQCKRKYKFDIANQSLTDRDTQRWTEDETEKLKRILRQAGRPTETDWTELAESHDLQRTLVQVNAHLKGVTAQKVYDPIIEAYEASQNQNST